MHLATKAALRSRHAAWAAKPPPPEPETLKMMASD
jgi:hypothetical protein